MNKNFKIRQLHHDHAWVKAQEDFLKSHVVFAAHVVYESRRGHKAEGYFALLDGNRQNIRWACIRGFSEGAPESFRLYAEKVMERLVNRMSYRLYNQRKH